MSFTLPRLLKPATVEVLRHMRHWSDVLFRAATSAPPEVHIYVDGSWHEGLQLGGYAVAVLLVTAGSASLLGSWVNSCRVTHRHPGSSMRPLL